MRYNLSIEVLDRDLSTLIPLLEGFKITVTSIAGEGPIYSERPGAANIILEWAKSHGRPFQANNPSLIEALKAKGYSKDSVGGAIHGLIRANSLKKIDDKKRYSFYQV